MNRALVFGIAIFFAVVGIALLGGETNKVLAGHGCRGCQGCDGGCDGGCAGNCACDGACNGCHGRQGLLARIRARRAARRCCGNPCCGPANCCCPPEPCGCCGHDGGHDGDHEEGHEMEGGEEEAPPAAAGLQRSRFGFRTVHFRR